MAHRSHREASAHNTEMKKATECVLRSNNLLREPNMKQEQDH